MRHATARPFKIIITGITRGLGRAMLDEFVRYGHFVCGCARTKKHIVQLAHLYPKHDFYTLNVASNTEVGAWAKSFARKHGAPDFVINNAAVINPQRPLWQIDDRHFAEAVDINIKGVANVVRHFAPLMIKSKCGVVVNLTSRWGTQHEKHMVPYCATKWAIVALTNALAEELHPYGVAACTLNPGLIRTQMLQRYLGIKSAKKLIHYSSPEEWAKQAVPLILKLRIADTGKALKVAQMAQSK